MPSQPDYERARTLSPHLFPPKPEEEVIKLRTQVEQLAQRVAKAEKKTVEEVLKESADALGDQAPAKEAPPPANANAEGEATPPEAPVVTPPEPEVPAENQYFGSAKGDKYYPVADQEKSKIKEENRVYFVSEEEAQEKGYQAA